MNTKQKLAMIPPNQKAFDKLLHQYLATSDKMNTAFMAFGVQVTTKQAQAIHDAAQKASCIVSFHLEVNNK